MEDEIVDSMSLLDRLRPKWQSTDVEVRAQAVRDLDKTEVELLTAVAQQDPDAKVRRIAVKKLESPRLLLSIAESDEDDGIRSFSRKRARQLLVQIACDGRDLEESKRALLLLTEASDRLMVSERARFPEVRAEAFDSLDGDDALVEVVTKGKDPDLRSRALARIAGPQALKKIILDEASGDLAFPALARLSDVAALEAVFEQHTLARSLRRQAFAKLEKLVPPDHPIKARARQERFQEVCQLAESLADSRMPSSAKELPGLRRSWEEIEAEGSAEAKLAERFREALDRIAAVAAPEPDSASPPETVPEEIHPADPATERASRLLERLESLQGEELASGIEQASAEWEEIASGGTLEGALQTRFRRALKSASSRLERLRAAESDAREAAEIVERVEAALREPDLAVARRELRALEKPWSRHAETADASLRDRIAASVEAWKAREEEARHHQQELETRAHRDLEARIVLMETLATAENLSIKDADRVLREAQEFLKTMGALPKSVNRRKARRQLVEAREKLFKRTQETRELEEWKRWANVDVQASLIERLEKLRASNDLPRVAKEMRQIHDEWKTAGAATPDKAEELWHKYKAIRDELKARCDAFFEKQAQARLENQKKKEELCARVEALQDSLDWNETAEAIKALQGEWKKIGPAPQEISEALWKRFRAACDLFFGRRKEKLDELKSERERNLARKIALCEQAEAIASSTDWHRAANELKKLQADWRTIGAVPKKKSDEVWKRFRKACDYFFERMKRRDEIENEERETKRQKLVEDLAALGAGAPGDAASGVASQVEEIWTSWKELGPIPRDKTELVARFEAELGALIEAAPATFAGTELDPAASGKKREKICARMEAILQELEAGKPASPASPGSEDLEDLARRLKDALASNTIGGGRRPSQKLDWHKAAEEVTRLRASWTRTAPAFGDKGRSLAERFERAVNRFFELRPTDRPRPHALERASAAQS